MDIVLILGGDNSGKSTLVRCLSGLGRGNHRHPSNTNVAQLNWGNPVQPLGTLCLISSLNEGTLYPGTRIVEANGVIAFGANNTISPGDLETILTAYVGEGCSKAILCISTSVQVQGWSFTDYLALVANGKIGQHRVSAIIKLVAVPPNVVTVPTVPTFAFPGAPHPRNDIAAGVRQSICLQ